METCSNCGAEFNGKYCTECGQGRVKRLEVKTIVHDVTHGILHWENSFLRTFKNLVFSPGRTVKEYIKGKRKYYVKPFTYFIFIQTVFVIVFHWMSEKYFAFLNVSFPQKGEKLSQSVIEIQHLISGYVNYFNYVMPLIFGLYLFLFLKKKTGINYAEALAASFYWAGTSMVFSVILILLSALDERMWNARGAVSFVYYTLAIKGFAGYGYAKGILKGLLITFLSYISFLIFVLMAAFTYLYLFKGINLFKMFSKIFE